MLSILIPIYNFDVTDLVRSLAAEADLVDEEIEIVLVDDNSENHWKKNNRLLQEIDGVKYEELSENMGRSAIRNYLSEKAKYNYFLFLDNDMGVVSDDFLRKYFNNLEQGTVLTGGLCYQTAVPSDDEILHWTVGKDREVISAEVRQQTPYDSFLSCNFLVPKPIFKSVKFDETLTQYGHEDTLFGLELERQNIEIVHIDNPLEHRGLESSDVFLSKTEKAIENLVFLYNKTGFSKTKLIHTWLKINKLGLPGLALHSLKMLKPIILYNLKSKSPKLFFFDLFKLMIFLEKS